MKAIVYTQYGSPQVLHLEEVGKPVPKVNEILINIKATAANTGDVVLRKAEPFAVRFFFGLIKPKLNILGSVFSGEVESVGKEVRLFKAGDQVFGATDMRFGSYSEFICLPESGAIAIKPDMITHLEAAAIPFGATTALHFIKLANIKSGQKVLIYGASGAVGTAAVQIAKYFGANVTGVCSTANIELVKSIGADNVIDYLKDDFTQNDEIYDVIFDTVKKISFSSSVRSLHKNGILISSAAGMSEMVRGLWTSASSKRKVITGVVNQNQENMGTVKKLIELNKLRPVIDRTYKLEQMAEAHSYIETGHKKGNVAISVCS